MESNHKLHAFIFPLLTFQIPYHLLIIYLGMNFINQYSSRRKRLLKSIGRGLDPNLFERFLGILCFSFIIIQYYFKIQSKTLIFIVNPCHLNTVNTFFAIIQVTYGIVFFFSYNKFTQLCFNFSTALSFGAYDLKSLSIQAIGNSFC